jgi:hypothetical protein
MDIEIGDIKIRRAEVASSSYGGRIKTVIAISRVKAQVSAYSEDESVEIDASLELMEESHPELKEHCDAIRLYMLQEAKRLLNDEPNQ